MNKLTKATSLFALCLMLNAAHADEGSVSLGSDIGAWILAVLVGWPMCAVVIYCAVRTYRRNWAAASAVLFFLSPFLLVAAYSLWRDVFGTQGESTQEIAQTPVVVGGATFPAGSEIDYRQAGFGRWSHTPTSASSDFPVKFGTLEILNLQIDQVEKNRVHVTLAHDQAVGKDWSCAESESATSLDISTLPPRLLGCALASSVTLGDVSWPASSVLMKQPNGWTLDWQSPTFTADAKKTVAAAFGFPVYRMKGTYGPALDLKAWSGRMFGDGAKVGTYGLPKDDVTQITWTPDGALRIVGDSTDSKTGLKYACLMMRGKSVAPCSDAEANLVNESLDPF